MLLAACLFIGLSSCNDDDSDDVQITPAPTTSSTSLDGTVWIAEISASVGSSTSVINGTMTFTGNNFSYVETVTTEGNEVRLEPIDDFSGTYIYTGVPNTPDNIEFTFSDANGMLQTINGTLTTLTIGRSIDFQVDGTLRVIDEERTDNGGDEEIGETILDNTTWTSQSFFSEDFNSNATITIEFSPEGLCNIIFDSEDLDFSGEEIYSVSGNTVAITYLTFEGTIETEEGVIAGDVITISLYGEDLTLQRQ